MKEFFNRLGSKARSLYDRYGRPWFPLCSIVFICLLLGITIYKFAYDRPLFRSSIIASDVDKIVEILRDIDQRCNILSVDLDNNKIDFLTVKDFVGSEIGPINLAHPRNWNGSYLSDNPTLQGKLYEIVHARDGWYVVPGKGVVLPSGRVMGKDIVITAKSDLELMIREGGKLYFKGKPFAQKIDFVIGDWDSSPSKQKKWQEIDATIQEFSSALPYSKGPEFEHQS